MSKRTKWAASARGLVVAAGLASASVSSWAFTQVGGVNGFGALDAMLVDNSSKWALDSQGPVLSWNCSSSEDCSFTGELTTSVLIKPVAGKLVPSDTLSLGLNRLSLTVWSGYSGVVDATLGPLPLIDPYGHNHGYYQVDVGKWTFSASGSISVPSGALFMTAYGNNTVSLTDEKGAVYGGQKQLIGSTDTNLKTTFGPGAEGASVLPDDFKKFQLKQDLITPYFAYPSTTNPRCKDLSCLDYAAGIYTPDAYVFTFSLVSVPAPAVPEPSAAMLALAGLGAVAYAARRRKA